ncbi:MAG: hypothetical protein WCI27_10595 [Candidatus Omnitrophota bacterium]
MRTTNYIKVMAHVLLAAGILGAIVFYSPRMFMFWFLIFGSVIGWLVLRLLAIIGQLIFEIRHDFTRILSNIERSGQYSNALQQEIRDLMDEKVKGS